MEQRTTDGTRHRLAKPYDLWIPSDWKPQERTSPAQAHSYSALLYITVDKRLQPIIEDHSRNIPFRSVSTLGGQAEAKVRRELAFQKTGFSPTSTISTTSTTSCMVCEKLVCSMI